MCVSKRSARCHDLLGRAGSRVNFCDLHKKIRQGLLKAVDVFFIAPLKESCKLCKQNLSPCARFCEFQSDRFETRLDRTAIDTMDFCSCCAANDCFRFDIFKCRLNLYVPSESCATK